MAAPTQSVSTSTTPPVVTMRLGVFLQQPFPAPEKIITGYLNVTDKAWAHQMEYTIVKWKINRWTLDEFFLPVQDQNRGNLNKSVRYEQHVPSCHTEGDVEMNFMEHIIMPLKDAFHDMGLLFMSKHGKRGKHVDWTIKPPRSSQDSEAYCVGETKSPSTIDPECLLKEDLDKLTIPMRKLLRELKA
jgi:hypothetical protein